MKIYFIRHGQTDWNVVKRMQGSVDIPLNEEGRRLAFITAKNMEEVPFDIIYTSPLQRAKETAMIIKGTRNIPVIEDKRIIEMCFGKYEGCIVKEHPGIMTLFEHPEKYVAPEDGESLTKLCKRTSDFLEEIVNNIELENKTILISTHGAALKGLLRAIKTTPMSEFWGGGVQKNCAVTIAKAIDGHIEIVEEAITYY